MAATGYTPISLYYSTTAAATPTAGNLVNGELGINITDGKLYYKDNSGVVQLIASKAGASGSVTSVAQSFTGGLISVSGSPITTSGTLALTVAGTSGGIPYFSSASTWASSAALAANAIVLGGGAGAAPATTTTGTGVVTALGVNVGTAGAFVVNGGALGSPSSAGTMPAFTLGGTVTLNGQTFSGAAAFNAGITQTGSSGTLSFNQTNSVSGAIVNTKTATNSNSLGIYDTLAVKNNSGVAKTWSVGVNVNTTDASWELYQGGTLFKVDTSGNGTLNGLLSVTPSSLSSTLGGLYVAASDSTNAPLAVFRNTQSSGTGRDAYIKLRLDTDTYSIGHCASTNKFHIANGANLTTGLILSMDTVSTSISGSSADDVACTITNTSPTRPWGLYVHFTAAAPNSSTEYFQYWRDSGTTRAILYSNGGLANYSANNVNLSDLEVKPVFDAYASDPALRTKVWGFMKRMSAAWGQFKYDDQTHDDFNHGYGAQLVRDAAGNDFPELVELTKWGDKDRLVVYDSDLMHLVGAAMSMAIDRIEALEAKLQ